MGLYFLEPPERIVLGMKPPHDIAELLVYPADFEAVRQGALTSEFEGHDHDALDLDALAVRIGLALGMEGLKTVLADPEKTRADAASYPRPVRHSTVTLSATSPRPPASQSKAPTG